jgi:nucleoside-diphosphate-sugar epimerase
MMIFITGGLGFVDTQLSVWLLKRGHEVTIVDHSPRPKPYTPDKVKYISADTTPGRGKKSL